MMLVRASHVLVPSFSSPILTSLPSLHTEKEKTESETREKESEARAKEIIGKVDTENNGMSTRKKLDRMMGLDCM